METIHIGSCNLTTGINGINHLPKLKKISIEYSCLGKQDMLRKEVENHTNHPVLQMLDVFEPAENSRSWSAFMLPRALSSSTIHDRTTPVPAHLLRHRPSESSSLCSIACTDLLSIYVIGPCACLLFVCNNLHSRLCCIPLDVCPLISCVSNNFCSFCCCFWRSAGNWRWAWKHFLAQKGYSVGISGSGWSRPM